MNQKYLMTKKIIIIKEVLIVEEILKLYIVKNIFQKVTIFLSKQKLIKIMRIKIN